MIEKLKALEDQAGRRDWKYERNGYQFHLTCGKHYSLASFAHGAEADVRLAIALRNLAPELIALWKAAKDFQEVEGHFIMDTWGDAADALQALETKAAEVLK